MKAALLLITAISCLSAEPLSDVFARMDKAAAEFKGLTADVKNDTYVAMVKDHDLQQGSIRLKRGKKDTNMLIDFTGTEARTISLDGGQVRVFYPKTKQVQVWDVSNKRGLIDQFLLLGFGASSSEIKESYDVSFVGAEPVGGQPASHIKLVPKSADVLKQLRQAELWISDASGMPLQQKFVTSSTGDYKLVTYSNMKTNPVPSAQDLQLKLPKGAQIQKMGS